MKFIEKFNHSFGFTKNESRIILFLVGMFLFGLALKLFNVSLQSQQNFDYSESDSIFAARSEVLRDTTNRRMTDADSSDEKNANNNNQHTSTLININSATKTELATLPGIGDVMAERIIRYRQEHGPFRSKEDLLNVSGIGKKKFERIAPYVKVQ